MQVHVGVPVYDQRTTWGESSALFFETGLTSAGNSTVRGGELPCQPQRVSLSPPPQDWDSKCRTHSLLSPSILGITPRPSR